MFTPIKQEHLKRLITCIWMFKKLAGKHYAYSLNYSHGSLMVSFAYQSNQFAPNQSRCSGGMDASLVTLLDAILVIWIEFETRERKYHVFKIFAALQWGGTEFFKYPVWFWNPSQCFVKRFLQPPVTHARACGKASPLDLEDRTCAKI